MKKGKELKIDKYDNYNAVYGSVDNKNSRAVYINISAWAEPKKADVQSYNRIIKDFNKKLKRTLYSINQDDSHPKFIIDKSIVDLDIRESGVRYGKRSFTNCEVTLFFDSEISTNTKSLKPMIVGTTDTLIDSVFETSEYFKYYKRKK